ncbi:MAG: ribosome assembly cofactor RimP [Lacinutrix sp.]|uniref:ribosome assembly cofactor RimP n=1 Tax=Lacinutrix sp. TaxID=1937692 RepID=UPI0030A1BB06
MFNTTVKDLLNEALEERTDLFLIEFTISIDQSINIIIDGDNGVRVEDCILISRAIEHNIDREEHDFSLEVASAGAAALLTLPRQFKKNIGRTLEVKTKTENIEAELVNASEEEIDLTWKAREPKPVGKGKVTVKKNAKIAYNDVVEAKVMINFNSIE